MGTSVDPSTYSYCGYTLNENGILAHYGLDGNPMFYTTDFYAAARGGPDRAEAPRRRSRSSSRVAFLAPHGGGPRDPDDPRGLPTPVAGAAPPRPLRRRAAARRPPFNEADVSDKPAFIRAAAAIGARARSGDRGELPPAARVAAGRRRGGGARSSARCATAGELDDTLVIFTSDNGFFHGEHRVRDGKVLGLRAVDPRAAGHARAGRAAGRAAAASS